MSSPVYVPFHKRSTSASSMTSSRVNPVLTYTRDELLAMAPSTSTSHSADATAHSATEHTYLHPQPHNGWAALNTAMRSYLRLSCPEIVMNRKMRKSVEYQHFQHRASARAGSPTSQRARSRSPSAHSSASDDVLSRSKATQTEVPPQSQPAIRSTAIKPAPGPIKKRAQPRRTRSGTNTARARLNSFNIFHRQLAGAGPDSQWRRPAVQIVLPITPQAVAAH